MTMWRWAAHEQHVSIGSTNVEALADPRVGRVVVADHQTGGLGRLGRSWESPPGTGLAISVVVPAVPPSLMGWLPLAAGLAVAQALETSRWPVTVGLKWPNDVLVPLREAVPEREGTVGGTVGPPVQQAVQQPVLEADGMRWGKVAGVLAQVAGSGAVVIGTGLNLDHTAGQLPVPTATSWRLARGGAPLPDGAREDFLAAYLEHLAAAHDQLAATRHEKVAASYRSRSVTLGREVVVHLPDGGRAVGTAVDLDRSGALVLDGPEGRSTHHAGDVEHVRPSPAPGTDNLA